jgi:hypothetical protein
MFRGFISILLIAGLLTSNLAAMPHAHVVSPAERERHDARPHFHFDWFGANHSRSHGHNHPHTHARGERQHFHASSRGNSSPLQGLEVSDPGGDEHDSDAFYVPQVAASASAESKSQLVTLAKQVVGRLPEAVCSKTWPESVWRIWHPPDQVCDGSHLYLTIRQLRI